jgi:hypothetical protein
MAWHLYAARIAAVFLFLSFALSCFRDPFARRFLIAKERKGENAKEGRVARRASGFAIALIPLRLIVFGERDGQGRIERWRGIFTRFVFCRSDVHAHGGHWQSQWHTVNFRPRSSFFCLSPFRVFAILLPGDF